MKEKKRIGKATLIKTAREINSRKRELLKEAENLKKEYQRFRNQYQPQIDNLKFQADKLAEEFRRLYREASEAYASDQKALAKSLSVQGHVIQEQCEALNAQANALRTELKNLIDQINVLFQKAKESEKQAEDCRIKARELRQTSVYDFEKSRIINDEEIEEILDEFPRKVFKKIKLMKFSEKIFWTSKSGETIVLSMGMVNWDKDNKAIIEIGKQSSKERFKEVVAHEIGHVVYEELLDEQKAEWYSWHEETNKFISPEAIENEKEDFAECFRLFKLNPNELEKKDFSKSNFVREIYLKLEEENEKT